MSDRGCAHDPGDGRDGLAVLEAHPEHQPVARTEPCHHAIEGLVQFGGTQHLLRVVVRRLQLPGDVDLLADERDEALPHLVPLP